MKKKRRFKLYSFDSMAGEVEGLWLRSVKRVLSPNCDLRPDGSDVSLLVLHNISLPPGEYATGYIDALFTNSLDCDRHPALEDLREAKVSSHLMIDREGEVTQYVAFDKRAWHAGHSDYQGRHNCNDFAIGIELEGVDTTPYQPAQYRTLVGITVLLLNGFNRLSLQSIVGHSEIAPTRKTDPGPAFDWRSFLAAVREKLQ